MKIVIVSTFYSKGLGYTENCLPRALADRGHDVHVLTSSLNVYGTSEDYRSTYETFLGPADQGIGCFNVDNYMVHRLPYSIVGGYVAIVGLAAKLRQLHPEIVHSTAIASLSSFKLALLQPVMGFRLFTECHQHLSVVKPFLKQRGHRIRKAVYRLTRTLPSRFVCLTMERCYAVAPDCLQVAADFYGVPTTKLKLQSLGTDTTRFRPAEGAEELAMRTRERRELGFEDRDVVCVYTGRLSNSKNPLVLAQAIDRLAHGSVCYHGLFVGDGEQREQILRCRNTQVIPFMRHAELAKLYRLADVAVWPRQESMSMLDAAASGLPIVVSADIGESERVGGNGRFYVQDDVDDLARALGTLASGDERRALGKIGRDKMSSQFSWSAIAETFEKDYRVALGHRAVLGV